MTHLDLAALRAFVAVVDTGSITAAAERVSRTQAAVSMQISKLERSLGKPLLKRLPRGVEATPTGEHLLTYARRMVRLEQEAVNSVVRPPLRGTVRIGTPDDYAHCFLPRILARFAEAEPAVAVELHCQTSDILRRQIRDGELDLVLASCEDSGLDGRVVHSEPIVFATVPGAGLELQEMLPLAMWLPGCPIRAMTLRALDEANIAYRVAYSSPSNAGLQAAVLSGLAVGAMARSTLTPDMVVLDESQGMPGVGSIHIALYRSHHRQSAVIDELHEHILHSFRNQHEEPASTPWALASN
ncbi:LysR substrate-binding domain-containing protein [Arhodomonas sp. AD133]|uniref:LysR substrate-binding domain-containing protein n=1 Tax=Arhodomonas sp. AD133 TaxID=3415009 RepID=UPI003EBBF35B